MGAALTSPFVFGVCSIDGRLAYRCTHLRCLLQSWHKPKMAVDRFRSNSRATSSENQPNNHNGQNEVDGTATIVANARTHVISAAANYEEKYD